MVNTHSKGLSINYDSEKWFIDWISKNMYESKEEQHIQ